MQRWGSVRAGLRDGDTAGRVSLAEAASSPDAVGLGALAGLEGEIAVIHGQSWISRVEGGAVRTSVDSPQSAQAALLFLSEVPAWSEHRLVRDVELRELEALLLELGTVAGLAGSEAFPFVVDGQLEELETHVLNGACPLAGEVTEETRPARDAFPPGPGRLMGFYSFLGPGVITHHDSPLHVHVVLEGSEPYAGHVDAVRITRGSKLSIPRAQ